MNHNFEIGDEVVIREDAEFVYGQDLMQHGDEGIIKEIRKRTNGNDSIRVKFPNIDDYTPFPTVYSLDPSEIRKKANIKFSF